MCHPIAAACLIGFAVLVATPASAERPGKGRSLVSVGFSGHTGQFLYPFAGPAILGIESDEVGGHAAYTRFLSDWWTLGISVGYHVGREKSDQNRPDGTPASTRTLDTYSFTVGIEGDRYAFIDDRVAIYVGPGVFFTRGRATQELTMFLPAAQSETTAGPYSTEVGLNGRIGVYARLGRGTALYGHVGQVLSRMSGKDYWGKVIRWSSTSEGSAGLAFDF